MHLALRNLFQDKVRLALSVVGIALAVTLILFLLGLRAGVFEGAAAHLENSPGSVAVMPPGVKSTVSGSGQYLAPDTAIAAARVPGVARVTAVLQARAMPELHGKKEAVVLIGYDATLGGGPWDLSAGRLPATDDEAVLDRVLAGRHDIEIGDTFAVGGRQLRVVGLSRGTSSLSGSYVFARKSLVESLTLAPGAASYLLLTLNEGASQDQAIAALSKELPGTTVFLKSQLIANDRDVLAGAFDQVIFVMVGVAFVVGALVVGMVLYTATLERRAEYGIMKAIGAKGRVLYRIVFIQAAVAAGLGVSLGILFAYGMGWLVMSWRPQLLVSIEPSALVVTLAAGFVMALLGALLPARSVVRLAPAEVFRR